MQWANTGAMSSKPRLTGAILKEWRRSAEKTQVEVAVAMGTGQSEVSLLEARGELGGVRLDTLRRYAEAVGGHLEITLVRGRERMPVRC